MIYWSLFLVASVANAGSTESNYVAIASFDSRLDFENATRFNNDLIVQFNTTDIHIRCLKTNVPVINELIKLKETAELGH